MKVVAFNGSPRTKGNTTILIDHVFVELEKEGIATERVDLCGEPVRGCTACLGCRAKKDQKCAVTSDPMNEWIAKAVEADGIILASPTYFADVSAEMKALIDRLGFVSKANGDMLQRKVGAAVVAVRRAGALHVFDTMNHFFLISQMIVPGSCYWNMGYGLDRGDVNDDAEGLRIMSLLGKNMAWLMHKLNTGS